MDHRGMTILQLRLLSLGSGQAFPCFLPRHKCDFNVVADCVSLHFDKLFVDSCCM